MIDKLIRLFLINLIISYLVNAFDGKQLGYYAFEKADRNNMPPRIRSPPYMQTDIPCSGVINDKYFENKDTLCGDLKRGYIPLNPMNIIIQNQHYPFELIKNKTLHFLAKTLPYLKSDHENIPKVFKIAQTGYNELYSNLDQKANPSANYRVKRQATRQATITKLDKLDLNLNDSVLVKNNQHQNASNINLSKKSKGVEEKNQESRQKNCENDGIICHVMQVLTANSKSNGDSPSFFNTLSNTYQAYKAAKDFGNFVQSLTTSLDKSDNSNEKNGNDQYSNRPILSQVLSVFNSMGNTQGTTSTPMTNNQNSNNYNPLGALIDYLSNSNSALSRKKKPMDYEDYLNAYVTAASSPTVAVSKAQDEVAAQQIQIAQQTPTVCPSIEEYVTPIYARNYQGIWKYVVQIPHEGYFTQTIQKTSCVKNKCDYIDGMCKEASRWVSLLVAEVYYPNAKQPLSNMISQSSQIKPTIYNDLNAKMNNQQHSSPTFPANEQSLFNYDLFNSLLPNNFNEYNHYDQTFARRASKNPQSVNQFTNQPKNQKPSVSYPSSIASHSVPQFQETNLNNQYQEFNLNNDPQNYQPNYNQFLNAQQYSSINNKQPINQPLTQAQKAQFQKLIDIYQQQYFQQLSKTSKSNNAIYGNLIDNLSSASIVYPIASQQSGTGLNQQLSNQLKQNDVKPRSFDTVNSHNILESTLMKSSYINNEDNLMAAASSSNDNKMVLNDQIVNSKNQPIQSSDLNNNNINSQSVSNNQNTNEQNENTSKENNEECDGFDNNGCYVIRVYYDWFLVGGSCKCWKTNAKTNSFETLKKIFIGK